MPPLGDLEDFTARPHSAVSVLRTFIGVHLRRIGGWIAVADLVELCATNDNGSGIRTALSRLKAKGLLEPRVRHGRAGYRLAPAAVGMLERGDRRIFAHRRMQPDQEGWFLAVFSVPDSERHLRHQLRQHLLWLGCGTIAPGTWVGPGHLMDEASNVLQEHGLRDYVTIVRATELRPPRELAATVTGWWDFDALNDRYRTFIAAHADTENIWDRTNRMAFTEHLRLVDDWRAIPYLDPGLPPELTPPGWLGHRGLELFLHLQDLLAQPAARHVDSVVHVTKALI